MFCKEKGRTEIGGGEALVEATQTLLLVDAANAIQGARVGQALSLHLVGLQLEPRLDQPDGRDHGRRHHAWHHQRQV
jgi:hypothetical protein